MELLFTHCLPPLIGIKNKEKLYEIKILTADIPQFFTGNYEKKPFKLQTVVAVFPLKKYK
jgi:hypothetical protein